VSRSERSQPTSATRGEGSASDEPPGGGGRERSDRAEPTSVKGVLWDFGGVLSSSPFEAFARYEEEQGLPHGFIRRVNSTDHHTNAWARFERSELSFAEFDEAFAVESERLGHRVPGADVLELLMGDLRPAMFTAVRRCRDAGFTTGLLTNNVAPMQERGWSHEIALDDLFDVVVESAVAGVRKPEVAAYELVLSKMGVGASEVVFLDDLGVNLKPAREMGMTTIKVVDPDDALTELEAVLGISLG
jgi:putative hydrolase of the HAD superfamily